jgi:hypothetical protein
MKWAISLAVWVVLGLSFYFYPRHPWINTVWLLITAVVIVSAVIDFGFVAYREKGQPMKIPNYSYGLLRWFGRARTKRSQK